MTCQELSQKFNELHNDKVIYLSHYISKCVVCYTVMKFFRFNLFSLELIHFTFNVIHSC